MALTSTITIKSVKTTQEGLFTVTLNLKYVDGSTVLLDQDFSENYWRGYPFSVVFANFKEKMKDVIQRYKEEQTILNGTGLATIVTNLNNTVGV